MADPILDEFKRDLAKLGELLDLVDAQKNAAIIDESTIQMEEGEAKQILINLLSMSKLTHTSLPIMTGSLFLYVVGRFEEFSRTGFEDLCQRMAAKANSFSQLPKEMRSNVVIYTAKVMDNPRKFGHGDGGVKTFVTTLSDNLVKDSVDEINYQCLSITESNMRAEVLADMYRRIGVKDLWKKISNQAQMLSYFETQEASQVEKHSTSRLDEIMRLRNDLAHPSGTPNWPTLEKVREYSKFLVTLAEVLTSLSLVYEGSLVTHAVDTGEAQSKPSD